MSEPAENQFLLKLPKEARDHLAGSGDENRQRRESAASKKRCCDRERLFPGDTLHSIEERCARWILMTQDRMHAETLPLTQETLAQMLGVRRPTVTLAAGMLKKAGLIEYSRGSVKVLNHQGLESAACGCYKVIKEEFDRLQG